MLARLRKIHWRTLPWPSILFRVAAAFVGLFMALSSTYAIGVNALLWTGVGKAALNHASPAHVHFEWRTAYSPWFMRVRTTGFVFRGESSSAQWLITSDRANGSFRLVDFFSRRVHLHDMAVRGISTRIRFKLDPADATADYVAGLPPIAGFSDPPLKPVPLPVADGHNRDWTVEIDDIVAENVREVWVDTIRTVDTEGGRAEGGFYFQPHRRLFIRPTECLVEDASVFDGKDTITSELKGTFNLQIAEVDLSDVHGAEILRHVDGKAKGHAKVGDLHFLNRWLHSAHIAFAGGAGPTQFAVEMQRGALVSGSRAWMRAEGWSLWSNHDGVSGTSLVSASVPEGKPHLAIAVETYGLGIHRDKTNVVHAPVVAASAQIDNLDMTEPLDRWAVSIDVPSATAKDLKALNAYLDEPMLYAGSATLKGHANITPHAVSGHGKVDVSSAIVEVRKTKVTASGTAEATLHGLDLRSGKGDLAGARLDLRDVSGADQSGWWAYFSASPLSIALEHGIGASGMVTGKCKNAQLPLTILDAPGIVRSVFGSQGFTVSTRARLSSRATDPTDLRDLRIIGNTIEVRAHYHGGDGVALVETPFINVGVLVRNGETTTHLFATRDWYTHTIEAKPRAARRTPN